MALVIGDIHGHCAQLKNLLDYAAPSHDTPIVTLGDYIDRGPDSRGVIDTLLALGTQLCPLKGNHEVFMEQAMENPAIYQFWLSPFVGGKETLDSYGGTLDSIPHSHWKFIHNTSLYVELDHFICVHGGIDPAKSLTDQDPDFVLNHRFDLAKPHPSGKIVICGHTRQTKGEPKLRNNTLCIDTGVYSGGWLTAFDTTSQQFFQVNATGKRRTTTL